MIILGLNAFHADSSAALLRDGKLIAAAEEERFRRIKHRAGFPSQAIAFCLQEAGARLADVEHIAFNQDSSANLPRKIGYFLKKRPNIKLVLNRLRNRRAHERFPILLDQSFPSIETTLSWGAAAGREIVTHGRVYFPHSLGIFYQALTQYLGFSHYGDEYKVMGSWRKNLKSSAPYGQPSLLDDMRNIVRMYPDGGFARGETKVDSRRHPRRWLWPSANGLAPH
jgi:carbamoyltransferase